jgi:catechol 2,3-dioxygenase
VNERLRAVITLLSRFGMREFRIPPGTHLGAAHLRVVSLPQALGFYCDVLGFRRSGEDGTSAVLSPAGGGPAVLVLRELGGPPLEPADAVAPFHVAILVPSRAELARVLARVLAQHWRLGGAADHTVSESIYLADPDDTGLEIYADRLRRHWTRRGGDVFMNTEPLDLLSLIRTGRDEGGLEQGLDPQTRVGHVHLEMPDLKAAEAFYAGVLGFEVTVRGDPGALFLSAGGYHHHVAVKRSTGEGEPRSPDRTLGLTDFEIVLGDPGALPMMEARLQSLGIAGSRVQTGWRIQDPSGIGVIIRSDLGRG